MRKIFIATCIGLVSFAYFLTLVIGSYWQVPITELISFRIGDGHCDSSVSGFGVHCFGDYQLPLQNIKTGDYWGSNAYPPLALLPFFLASFLSNYFDDRVILALYLSALFISMLVPALYVIRRIKIDFSNIVALVILGFAAHPVIMNFDRGSSAGFVVPVLFLFAISVKNDSTKSVLFASLAVSWRPQYALLLLLFIGIGRIRRFILSVALTFLIYCLAFLLIPGGFVSNFRNWMVGISEHGSVGYLFGDGGAKVSTARGVFHAARFMGELHPSLKDLGFDYLKSSYGTWFSPGYLLVGLTTFVFIRFNEFKDVYLKTVVVLALSALVFPITYGYYNVFAVVIGALIMLEMSSSFGASIDLPSWGMKWLFNLISRQWWEFLVVIATAITLAPIPVPTNVSEQTLNIEYSGLIWTIVVLLGLVKISSNSIWARGLK